MKTQLVSESLYEFLNESKSEVSFISPELDYSELFRLYNVLNKDLPDNIDKSLFDSDKYYAQIIPEKMNELGLNDTPIVMAGGVWYLREWEDWIVY